MQDPGSHAATVPLGKVWEIQTVSITVYKRDKKDRHSAILNRENAAIIPADHGASDLSSILCSDNIAMQIACSGKAKTFVLEPYIQAGEKNNPYR